MDEVEIMCRELENKTGDNMDLVQPMCGEKGQCVEKAGHCVENVKALIRD